MIRNNWDPNSILNKAAATSLTHVLLDAGVVAQRKMELGAGRGQPCILCMCDVEEGEAAVFLECGHSGHVDCLGSFLTVCIAGEAGVFLPLSVTCPFERNCGNVVSETVIEKTVSGEAFGAYMAALHSQVLYWK